MTLFIALFNEFVCDRPRLLADTVPLRRHGLGHEQKQIHGRLNLVDMNMDMHKNMHDCICLGPEVDKFVNVCLCMNMNMNNTYIYLYIELVPIVSTAL